eukprot:CAMPEP_0173433174 /NCGR_PEP_ID=MMETSP1357-20121228/10722_1 /TAXON_ID=77926 /ORGANISM="Hemiselmis rufescens, Strain PCC563" /LENGTH=79 /DNA_ID=CAMNT_0014397859 /DNA_START=12 /DNA_END=248 /DNA_ORIENTATION=+
MLVMPCIEVFLRVGPRARAGRRRPLLEPRLRSGHDEHVLQEQPPDLAHQGVEGGRQDDARALQGPRGQAQVLERCGKGG